VAIGLIAAAYFLIMFFGKNFFPENSEVLLSLNVFSGEESPNHLIRIVSLAILTLIIGTFLSLLIERMAKDAKLTKRTGIAFIELLGKVVKFVVVLALIFLILSALGVDTPELLAGLGILSLILGLSVTSLIEDIVAGGFIIAEHLFDVGDIVVADGFRGTILSIGVRSTQIEDQGGDVMIVRNSSIRSLVNMTNRSSYAICSIPISKAETLHHVEEVINNANLDSWKEKYPEIEQGPFYLGLSEIDGWGLQWIVFVAICKENNKYYLQRNINRELKLLFEDNDVKVG
jgi:small conductance mechanosensitive channel